MMSEEFLSLDYFYQGRIFLNGIAYLVPGDFFLMEEVRKMPDYQSQLTFCKLNNYIINDIARTLPAARETELMKSYEDMAKILGYSWDDLTSKKWTYPKSR